jgi:hypothetical protein
MENTEKIRHGLEELKKILNLMEYDVSKTSVENLISEQRIADLKPQAVSSQTIAPGAKLGQYAKSGQFEKNIDTYNKYAEAKKTYCSGPKALEEYKSGNLRLSPSYKTSAVDATYSASQDVAKQKAYYQQCKTQLSKFPKWVKETYEKNSVSYKKYTSNDGDNFFVNMKKGEFAEAFLDLRESMWTDSGIIISSLIFYVGGLISGGILTGAEEVLWFCFMIADYFQIVNNTGSERIEGVTNLILDGIMIATGLLAGPLLKKMMGWLKKLTSFSVESVAQLIETYYNVDLKSGITYLIQKLKSFLGIVNRILSSFTDKGEVSSFITSNSQFIKTEVENVIKVLEGGVKKAKPKGVKPKSVNPSSVKTSTSGKVVTKLTAKQILKKSVLHLLVQIGILKLSDYAISKLFGVSKESAKKLRTDEGRESLSITGEADKFISTAAPETLQKINENKDLDQKSLVQEAKKEVIKTFKEKPKETIFKEINKYINCLTIDDIFDFFVKDNIYFIVIELDTYEWFVYDKKLVNTQTGDEYKCK